LDELRVGDGQRWSVVWSSDKRQCELFPYAKAVECSMWQNFKWRNW